MAVQYGIERARARLMGVVLEEVDDVPPARVVLRMREHRGARAWPREGHFQDWQF